MSRSAVFKRAIVLVTVAISLVLLFVASVVEGEVAKSVKEPAVAGMFYPADPKELRTAVESSLKAATKESFDLPIVAIMAPHAGYVYCGKVLASAYKQIEGDSFRYDTVVLLGPCHRVPTKAAAVSSAAVWRTPLGPVEVDRKLAERFVQISDRIEFDDRAHAREHSLEVQLPYLLVAARGRPFKIVPILTNSPNPADQEIVAQALVKLASGPRTLIVVSTDLSHYPSAADARRSDRAILDAVVSLDAGTLRKENRRLLAAGYPGLDVTMCGLDAVLCLELAARGLGISKAKVIGSANSAAVSGDKGRVVGYGAVVFMGRRKGAGKLKNDGMTLKFSEKSRKELLAMARDAVVAAVSGKKVDYSPSENPELQVKAGCFVTLKNKGRLRGCIGRFVSTEPLWRTVREMAVAAATEDPRFRLDPIRPAEVPQLHLEISVLSPLRQVKDPLKEIELGLDGVLIRDKGRSGTFLPQVATETGWSLEEFLGHCSQDKAGLGWDGWKSPSASVYAYRVTIIEEDR